MAKTAQKAPEEVGLYASDRDMFVFLINAEQPIEVGNARLSRGFFCWNSETGAATFGLTTFLYNHVCGNGVVWGAEQVEELKIIHRHRALSRFYLEAVPVLNRFVENRTLNDRIKDTVHRAMAYRVGDTVDEVIAQFRRDPFTKGEPPTRGSRHFARATTRRLCGVWCRGSRPSLAKYRLLTNALILSGGLECC